jgi:hypothetical protein
MQVVVVVLLVVVLVLFGDAEAFIVTRFAIVAPTFPFPIPNPHW